MALAYVQIVSKNVGLSVRRPVVRVLRIGTPGPPGPAGSGSGGSPTQESVFSLSGNQTIFVLGGTPASGTVDMFVNGMRQGRSNFGVSGATVTVTGFTPTTGDDVTFTYQLEA